MLNPRFAALAVLALAAGALATACFRTDNDAGSAITVVIPPPPILAAVTPASGVAGQVMQVTLAGSRFASSGTSIAIGGSGVAASAVSVFDSSTISATFSIDSAATLGAHPVTVSTGAGTSGSINFTVIPPTPTLASVVPATITRNSIDTLTLTGTHFVVGQTTLTFTGMSVPSMSVIVSSSTRLTAIIFVDPSTPVGPHDIAVTTPGGTSGPLSLNIGGG